MTYAGFETNTTHTYYPFQWEKDLLSSNTQLRKSAPLKELCQYLSAKRRLPFLGTTQAESDFILIVIVYIRVSLKSSGKPFSSHTVRLK